MKAGEFLKRLGARGVRFYRPVAKAPAPPSIEVGLFSEGEDVSGPQEIFVEAAPSEDYYAY